VVGQKQRGMVSDSDRDRAWPSVAEGTWAITHSTPEDAGRFGASVCQALFVKVCAGAVAVAVAVAAAPPANDNHNHDHNPILGRTKYLHFLFPKCFVSSSWTRTVSAG
jgi:hypothetical protein